MSALLRFSARGFSDISPLVRRAPARFFPRLGLKYSTAHSRATEVARQENWRRRVDLAAAYRGLEKYSFNEGVWNHLSMLAPAADGSGEVMLITPYGLHWSEVGLIQMLIAKYYSFKTVSFLMALKRVND